MKLKRKKLTAIGSSKGFIIPTSYYAENLIGGVETGKLYDLDITESEEAENVENEN